MIAPPLSPHPQRDFERLDSAGERLRFLLQYATLAPSSHNTQPWLWQIEGDEVALTADRSREMPAFDPQGRELILSCGAALHHLRLAIRAMGYGAIAQTFPDADKPDLLARVRLGSPRPATEKTNCCFTLLRSVTRIAASLSQARCLRRCCWSCRMRPSPKAPNSISRGKKSKSAR